MSESLKTATTSPEWISFKNSFLGNNPQEQVIRDAFMAVLAEVGHMGERSCLEALSSAITKHIYDNLLLATIQQIKRGELDCISRLEEADVIALATELLNTLIDGVKEDVYADHCARKQGEA